MALALDTDFRTALSSAVPENASRRTPEGGLGGEEFARNLKRVRESELTTAEAAGAQPSLLAAPASLPPVVAAAVAEDSAALLPASGSASLPAIDGDVEIGLDAERAAAAPVLAPPPSPSIEPAAFPAAVLVDPPVPVPEAVPVTSAVSDVPERVAAAPAATKPSEASAAIAPVTTEPPALPAVATVIANPNAAKAADQPGRGPAITQTGPAAARPLAKSGAEGSAPISADAQAALDAASPDLVNAASSTPADAALAAALSSDTGQSSAALGNNLGIAAAPSATTPGVTASAPPLPMTPAHAVVIASPAGIVDIVSQAAEDGQSDRIVVQLDPPELGRVSIDFKFDAQGLQHVTITSETPEAMRQLRMMHADLVQALERLGIAGQNMTFEHQQQSAQQTPLPNPFARSAAIAASPDDEAIAAIAAGDLRQTARTLPGGRLDMRL